MSDIRNEPEDFWEDRESTRKLAPVYANRMFVEPMGEGMLKISFGQFSPEGVDYYTSVVLTGQNAVTFGQHMARHGFAVLPPPPTPAPPAPNPFANIPPPGDSNG